MKNQHLFIFRQRSVSDFLLLMKESDNKCMDDFIDFEIVKEQE